MTTDPRLQQTVVVAGVGGVIIGHVVWLMGISVARTVLASLSGWVVLFSALFALAAAWAIHEAWQSYRCGRLTRAAFFGGLAASPVIFTVIVLGVTYL